MPITGDASDPKGGFKPIDLSSVALEASVELTRIVKSIDERVMRLEKLVGEIRFPVEDD